MGADVVQRLLVLAVFVAGVVEEGLNNLAGLVLPTVSASDVASGQAALLHLAPGPAQVPGAVQIPRLQPLQVFRYSRQVPQYAPQQPISSVPLMERTSFL